MEVGEPTFSVATCRRNMRRFVRKKTKAFKPAGPRGNHHQNRSVLDPSRTALSQARISETSAAWTNLVWRAEVRKRRYGRGLRMASAGVAILATLGGL